MPKDKRIFEPQSETFHRNVALRALGSLWIENYHILVIAMLEVIENRPMIVHPDI